MKPSWRRPVLLRARARGNDSGAAGRRPVRENPGILRLLKPGEGRGGGAPQMPPGQGVYQQHCQACHGANREGVAESGPPLVQVAADSVNNIVAGAPRFTGTPTCSRVRIVDKHFGGLASTWRHQLGADTGKT